MKSCPECGKEFSLWERVSAPSMCGKCYKASHPGPVIDLTQEVLPEKPDENAWMAFPKSKEPRHVYRAAAINLLFGAVLVGAGVYKLSKLGIFSGREIMAGRIVLPLSLALIGCVQFTVGLLQWWHFKRSKDA